MSAQVFISYSEPDEQAARRLADEIKGAGFSVWFAPRQVSPADDLIRIFAHIQAAQAFVVVLSHAAVHSPWVNKEIAVAVSCQISGSLRIIPARIESVGNPPALLDVKTVDLREPRWRAGVDELIAALRGDRAERPGLIADFERFVETLVPLDEKLSARISDHAPMTRYAAPADGAVSSLQAEEMRRNAAQQIGSLLEEGGVPPDGRLRILRAVAAGHPLPTLAPEMHSDVRRWLRGSDDRLIAFARALWAMREQQGVTLSGIAEFVAKQDGASLPERGRWEAERLAARAIDMGLLTSSTERPAGYRAMDARSNPSYDFGPFHEIIGRLIGAYDARKQNDANPLPATEF